MHSVFWFKKKQEIKKKNLIKKKYYLLRKKKYYEIRKEFFYPFIDLIKLKFKKKKIKIALYYPSLFEVNILKLLDLNYIYNKNLSLTIFKKNNTCLLYKSYISK